MPVSHHADASDRADVNESIRISGHQTVYALLPHDECGESTIVSLSNRHAVRAEIEPSIVQHHVVIVPQCEACLLIPLLVQLALQS